ncbi:MAG: hypothetical protein LBC85_06230 [Fibromonadaceae bacterium]|jgi:hypothetical protein|nr:hypothetical protein [Fibromonadaceae bacterium]
MKSDIISSNGEILIYQTEDGQARVEVIFSEETVWLTQNQIAQLFQKSKSTINEHLRKFRI